jgi:aspartate aminotransferase-like enzyme
MAKRKAPEISPEAQAANAAGEAGREKARQANAEKQKRFRKNMKAAGFRQTLLWDFPCPADVRERMAAAGFRQAPAWEAAPDPGGKEKPLSSGMVKVAAVVHETSIGIADKASEIHKALSAALGAFLREVETLPRSAWGKTYKDIQELLGPLGKI